METEGRTVEVQSIPSGSTSYPNSDSNQNRKLYATVAYHFPQYRLEEVEGMPYRDVALLLNTAQEIEASRMYNLTMIASAPQSENGKGVKALLDHFKKIFKG